MILLRTVIYIDDSTGVKTVYCVKPLVPRKQNYAKITEYIVSIIKKVKRKKFLKNIKKKLSSFISGKLCKCCIIRVKKYFKRLEGAYLKFNQNAGVIVNNKRVPVTSRVKGPMAFEICIKRLFLGCVGRSVI